MEGRIQRTAAMKPYNYLDDLQRDEGMYWKTVDPNEEYTSRGLAPPMLPTLK